MDDIIGKIHREFNLASKALDTRRLAIERYNFDYSKQKPTKMSDSEVKPFKIHIPDSEIEDLKQRLSKARFPSELNDAGWDYGAPLSEMKKLTAYWKDDFDWRVAEAKLNSLPQYTTQIQCECFEALKIHFVHKKSDNPNAIPLIFIHGWPGSFIEVSKIVNDLTAGTPAFDVVAPSLPNYAFSEGSLKKGFGLAQYAETCHKLMLKLEYSQYGSGYQRIQSTKPQTVAYALDSSPVALLAWIYEKLHDWTDAYPWTPDEVCTWVSIYAFSTMGPGASCRIYYDVLNPSPTPPADPVSLLPRITENEMMRKYVTGVKLGMTYFPQEIVSLPKAWLRQLGPVVFEGEAGEEGGGHFGAWERPKIIVRDLRRMFGKDGGAGGVVKGRSGYIEGRSRL
ncbi:MAG: hypothetical protein Q9227_002854 [Pyrenula ochraceoflavens]